MDYFLKVAERLERSLHKPGLQCSILNKKLKKQKTKRRKFQTEITLKL